MQINVFWGNEPLWEPPREPRYELLRCFVTAKTADRVASDPDVLKLMSAEDALRQINEFLILDWIGITKRPKDKLRCTEAGVAELHAYDVRRNQIRVAHDNIERAQHFEKQKATAKRMGGKLKCGHANDPYVCDVCRAYAERLYDPDEAPPLPHADCTSELGECRCFVSVITGE